MYRVDTWDEIKSLTGDERLAGREINGDRQDVGEEKCGNIIFFTSNEQISNFPQILKFHFAPLITFPPTKIIFAWEL